MVTCGICSTISVIKMKPIENLGNTAISRKNPDHRTGVLPEIDPQSLNISWKHVYELGCTQNLWDAIG